MEKSERKWGRGRNKTFVVRLKQTGPLVDLLDSTLSLKFLTLVFSLAPVALSSLGLEFIESLAAHAAQLPAVHCLICCLAFGTPSSLHGQPSQACAHRWVLGLLNQLVTLEVSLFRMNHLCYCCSPVFLPHGLLCMPKL